MLRVTRASVGSGGKGPCPASVGGAGSRNNLTAFPGWPMPPLNADCPASSLRCPKPDNGDCVKDRGQLAILDLSPTDVNECLTPGVCAHGKCINLEGSFRCSCEQGYEVTSDEKGCQGTKMLKHLPLEAGQPAAPSLCTLTPNPTLAPHP